MYPICVTIRWFLDTHLSHHSDRCYQWETVALIMIASMCLFVLLLPAIIIFILIYAQGFRELPLRLFCKKALHLYTDAVHSDNGLKLQHSFHGLNKSLVCLFAVVFCLLYCFQTWFADHPWGDIMHLRNVSSYQYKWSFNDEVHGLSDFQVPSSSLTSWPWFCAATLSCSLRWLSVSMEDAALWRSGKHAHSSRVSILCYHSLIKPRYDYPTLR